MTLHHAISRQKRTGVASAYLGLAWVMVVLVLSNADPPWVFLAIPGVVTFVAGALYLFFLVRCPHCRGRIGQVVGSSGGPFSISPKVQFCPLCGVALGIEIEAHHAA